MEYYISGEAAAFIGGNWDESYICGNPEREARHREMRTTWALQFFRSLQMQPRIPTSQNIGLGYAVAINAKAC
ncbi:MAG: hypothetical protein ACLR2E_16590 [Lachnospiraceae bacterium]